MRRTMNRVDPFHSIVLHGPGLMRISQAPRQSIVVNALGELQRHVEFAVVDNELNVALHAPTVVPLKRWRDALVYDLTVTELRSLRVLGSAQVEIPDLDCDELSIEVPGGGKVAIQRLTADRLRCAIGGSGRVQIAGDIETQEVGVAGSGHYRAEELISDFAEVKITGSGGAEIQVNHELDASVTGSGQIQYQGQPEVKPHVIGSGTIRRRSGRPTGDRNLEIPNS